MIHKRLFARVAILGLGWVLAACGGGGAGDASAAAGCVPTMLNPDVCAPQLSLTLTDAGGRALTQVTPLQPGTLRVRVLDYKGSPVANALVTMSSTDASATLVPASGSALTDATGLATVGLPAGRDSGAFVASATVRAEGYTLRQTLNYAVQFPSLTLSPLTVSPSVLASGGTASLSVTVLSGTVPYGPAQSVSFSSACAASGKATIGSPVITVNGVAATSYIDKGCGGPDTITASTTLAGAVSLQASTLTVLPAAAGQLVFVSALPQNLALKGTGGPGRQESSTILFRVLDRNGNPVSGAPVDFLLLGGTTGSTATGGITLNPSSATSSADGTVSTTVASGIVNTPVRVSATVRGSNPAVTTLSDQLVVSTGIPDQNSFSLSTEIYNVEGLNIDGCASPVGSVVRVSLADAFNNPVPDGTAVSFTAEGGTIDASCLTGLTNTQLTTGGVITQKGVPGVCTVRFCPSSPRPADGRVTILAYALGEESYVDNPANPNGVNRYEAGEAFQDLCEPFRSDAALVDAQANPTRVSSNPALGEAACPQPGLGEPYIDTDANGRFNATGNGVYNGVLNVDPATGQTIANARTPAVHVRSSLVQVLSSSSAVITSNVGSLTWGPTEVCQNGTPFRPTAKSMLVYIRDINPTVFPGNTLAGNVLPAGTKIDFSTTNGRLVSEASLVVPNTNAVSQDIWTYLVTVQSDATQSAATATPPLECTNSTVSGNLTVKVTTPSGLVTSRSFAVND